MRSDEELMLDAGRGARGAVEEIFARYRQSIWAFFRRRVSDSRTAEELAQDTFVALIEAAPRYQDRGAFRSYLFGIAYRVLLANGRQSRRQPETLDGDVPGDASEPDDVVWVRAALARLDADDREILMLREYEGLSYGEIAAVHRIPLNTVRSRLFRARMALKAQLAAPPARMPQGVGNAFD